VPAAECPTCARHCNASETGETAKYYTKHRRICRALREKNGTIPTMGGGNDRNSRRAAAAVTPTTAGDRRPMGRNTIKNYFAGSTGANQEMPLRR
jgi:hypothetical protein